MSEQEPIQKAWNPLTFRGAARFAPAKLPRLLLVELFFSFVVFVAVVWFVGKNYAPVIAKTTQKLPEMAHLEKGELTGIDSRIETDEPFLSLVIDVDDFSDTGTGDLQIGFGKTNVMVCSVDSSSWGCLTFDYPSDYLDVSRSSLQPWWGARQPFIIGGVGVLFVIGIFITLPLIAVVLMWVPKFFAYFADRKLTVRQAWNLAMAAQLPGLIVLAASVVLYGAQLMDLLGVGVFYILHILVDLVYLIGAVFFLPRIEGVLTSNPFGGSPKKRV